MTASVLQMQPDPAMVAELVHTHGPAPRDLRPDKLTPAIAPVNAVQQSLQLIQVPRSEVKAREASWR